MVALLVVVGGRLGCSDRLSLVVRKDLAAILQYFIDVAEGYPINQTVYLRRYIIGLRGFSIQKRCKNSYLEHPHKLLIESLPQSLRVI